MTTNPAADTSAVIQAEVSQADRELFSFLLGWDACEDQKRILDGEFDHWERRCIAAHRLSHTDQPVGNLDDLVAPYVESYEFRHDDGGSYVPNGLMRTILEDALHGFIGQHVAAAPASPAVVGDMGDNVEALWKRACQGREGYCSTDLQDAAKWAIGEAFRLAEQAARSATLPPDYEWSEGNREKFDFGRDTAADAIAALSSPAQSQRASGEVEREALEEAAATFDSLYHYTFDHGLSHSALADIIRRDANAASIAARSALRGERHGE